MPYCNNRVSRALQASDQAPKIGLKDFLFIKCIGVGGFSRVYLVKRLSTGRFYAMKLIDKEFIIKRSTECTNSQQR
jgi:serum/glucocorticoid-regulated kinase 2